MRNCFQAYSCNCITCMLHDTDCLRPVPLTFELPVWLVLSNRFMTQRASLLLKKGTLIRVTCWPIFLFKSVYCVNFMMMKAQKVSETSKLQSEVMGGGRWRSPEKIIQCCTIIVTTLCSGAICEEKFKLTAKNMPNILRRIWCCTVIQGTKCSGVIYEELFKLTAEDMSNILRGIWCCTVIQCS
jgi:hypothetical protein